MTRPYFPKDQALWREQGLTLIELLISIVVAGILGVALFYLLQSTIRSRFTSEQLTGRIARSMLMKEALEHTLTNAGYIANMASTLSTTSTCLLAAPAVTPALPIAAGTSAITVAWVVASSGGCIPCSGTFALSGNVASWTTTGGTACGQGNSGQNTAAFPVGTGWTLSAATSTSCLDPAFGTTAPAVIATYTPNNGTAPVEVSACLLNQQGQ